MPNSLQPNGTKHHIRRVRREPQLTTASRPLTSAAIVMVILTRLEAKLALGPYGLASAQTGHCRELRRRTAPASNGRRGPCGQEDMVEQGPRERVFSREP